MQIIRTSPVTTDLGYHATMLIRFFGADRTVTGSCHVVEADGKRIVLDFGMYQGARDESRRLNEEMPELLRKADAVILSHGHLDHCGRLPMLFRAGYRGPIYCTAATRDVARIVMLDAAKIQLEDANYLNRRSPVASEHPVRALFSVEDVEGVLRQIKTVAYDEVIKISKTLRVTLREAGHILGSTYVIVESDESTGTKRLLFTADVGRYGSPMLRDPSVVPIAADAVITESTYGTVKHAPMDEVAPQLLAILKDAIAKKGRVLLPSFAVGRTQTMLWYVQRFIQAGEIPALPIFVDSPMGAEVTTITEKYPDEYDDQTRDAVCETTAKGVVCELFGASRVTLAVTSDESRMINSVADPCVIIASSPTCEFGRILHHLKRTVEEPNDTIVFVGYTPSNTLGRRLQDGARRVKILDRLYDLKCRVKTLHGLSAHADGDELLKFLKPTTTKQTVAYVVHGEADRCDGFAARLVAAGMAAALAPASGTVAVVGDAPTGMRTGETAVATDE